MTNIRQAKRACALKKWAGIIEDCRSSGLTQSAYLAKHNISSSSYYYWLRMLRLEMLETSEVEAPVESVPAAASPQFAEVSLNEPANSNHTLVLRYKGCELEVNEATPETLLRRTLRAL